MSWAEARSWLPRTRELEGALSDTHTELRRDEVAANPSPPEQQPRRSGGGLLDLLVLSVVGGAGAWQVFRVLWPATVPLWVATGFEVAHAELVLTFLVVFQESGLRKPWPCQHTDFLVLRMPSLRALWIHRWRNSLRGVLYRSACYGGAAALLAAKAGGLPAGAVAFSLLLGILWGVLRAVMVASSDLERGPAPLLLGVLVIGGLAGFLLSLKPPALGWWLRAASLAIVMVVIHSHLRWQWRWLGGERPRGARGGARAARPARRARDTRSITAGALRGNRIDRWFRSGGRGAWQVGNAAAMATACAWLVTQSGAGAPLGLAVLIGLISSNAWLDTPDYLRYMLGQDLRQQVLVNLRRSARLALVAVLAGGIVGLGIAPSVTGLADPSATGAASVLLVASIQMLCFGWRGLYPQIPDELDPTLGGCFVWIGALALGWAGRGVMLGFPAAVGLAVGCAVVGAIGVLRRLQALDEAKLRAALRDSM